MHTLQRLGLLAFLLLVLHGCGTSDPTSTSAPKGTASTPKLSPPPATSKGITVSLGPNGQATVQGAAALHGDPKVCAAFKRCCTAPDMSLFCALSQDTEGGDCAKLLAKARQYAKEARINSAACQ